MRDNQNQSRAPMQKCGEKLSSSRAKPSIEKAGAEAEARVAAQAAASSRRLQHQIGLIRDWGSRGVTSSSHKVECRAKQKSTVVVVK